MLSHIRQRLTWLLLVLAAVPIAVPESSWTVTFLSPGERLKHSESSEKDLLDKGSLDETILIRQHRLRLVNRRVARREWSAGWTILRRLLSAQTNHFSANFLPAEFASRNGCGGPLRC